MTTIHRRSAHLSYICLLSAAGLALGLSGCGKSGQQPSGAGAKPPAQVTVVTLKAAPVSLTRELPGRARAYLIAEVRPQVDGIVKARLFEEGSRVRAGQPLYQLDDALYRAQLNNAKAALAKAQATRLAAKQRADRSAELVKTQVISRQQNEAEIAALGQADAEVQAAEAEVASNEVTVSYARVVAPIGGRTGVSTVTPGALVTAKQTAPLTTVQQMDPMYIDLTQSSSEWLVLQRELAAGQLRRDGKLKVKLVMEDGSVYPHEGELQFSDVSVDQGTGSYALRVVAPNPQQLLLPGMYVRARLDLGVRPEGVLAPQRGITRDAKGNATAMVVNADSKVEPRQVKVKGTVGDQWVIEDGLHAGDRLIVAGLQKIAPGAPVNAVEESATPPTAQQTSSAAGGNTAGSPPSSNKQ